MLKSVITFLMVTVSLSAPAFAATASSASAVAAVDGRDGNPVNLECLVAYGGTRAGDANKSVLVRERSVTPLSFVSSDPYVAPDFAASLRIERFSTELLVSVHQAYELTDSNSKIFLPFYELVLVDTAGFGWKVLESASLEESKGFSTLYTLPAPSRQSDGSLITDVMLTCKVQPQA